jgi:transcriptional regulator
MRAPASGGIACRNGAGAGEENLTDDRQPTTGPMEQRGVYVPEHFRESRIDVLQAFVDRHPLATLVAMGAGGLTANHIPLHAQLRADADGNSSGWLRGHIARANSLWRELQPGAAVLAVFFGADDYISPSWYPSKREHGKAVPTWNYATVHINGSIRFIDDAPWLRDLVGTLTDVHEHGRAHRWHLSDAPADYMEGMLRAIVGFEIQISSILGKFKGSQNRSLADRQAVSAALRAQGRADEALAEVVPDADPRRA